MKANQLQPPWRFDDSRVIRRGCPACGSTKIARVRMGMYFISQELERQFEAGKIRFGGCVIAYDADTGHSMNPERYCNACGTEWGRWVGPQCAWPKIESLPS